MKIIYAACSGWYSAFTIHKFFTGKSACERYIEIAGPDAGVYSNGLYMEEHGLEEGDNIDFFDEDSDSCIKSGYFEHCKKI